MKAPKEENLQKLNMRRREACMMEYHVKSISNNTNTKESRKKRKMRSFREMLFEKEKMIVKNNYREKSFI